MDMNIPTLQMTVFLTPVIFLYKELLKCLVLLKSAFFSPDWHSSIYKEACHQLNEERISALLRMLQPQLSVDERIAQRLGFLCSQIIAIRADCTLATKLESAITDN